MDLLNQIQIEHSMGTQYVQPKRTAIRNRIKKWNNQSKNKINITFVADTIDTLISSSYTDLLTVRFVSRDWFFAKDKASQLTYIARFDQQEQKYDQVYYQKEQDRYSMGISIRYNSGWDKESVAPTFIAINPLSAVPDPRPSQTGTFGIENYKFLWFHMRTDILTLKNSWTYDIQWLNQIIADYYNEQEQLNDQAYADAYWYSIPTIDTLTENFPVDIYHHMTIIDWHKHIVTLDSDLKRVLRNVKIKAVTKEEKENPSLIPRPVAINYWKPKRWSFFGESVRDYLEDKQDAMNIFANLAVATAKKEALWGRFLWNSRLIKNKEDILKPSVDTQHFWIDETQIQPWESIANAWIELPQPAIKSDVMWMYNFLESKWVASVWIDQLQRWVTPDKSMTKAETQQLQANANLLTIRNKRVDSRWDKAFWHLRWRSYIEYMDKNDKKLVILDNDFERTAEVFEQDTFSYENMPHIMVWTVADLDAQDEQRKQFLALYLPQIKQDPSKSELTKNELEREYLRLNWYSQNQINEFVPLSADERVMLDDYIPMINADIVPEWIFSRLGDIFTWYIYTQKAQDTNAKKIMLETFKKIMVNQWIDMTWWMWETWTQPEQWWQMANSAANIGMAQASQQIQWEDLVTRGNLKTNP